ncbi:UNVERIFIED_CONTAM: Transposon Tf2-12 polyprotein [Sesamum radiatum]|uniref:Transposon Tf2-12 polyprotein n=1 Tax=Sesamum radiatum TaxID=300843 RepID=A0AAW2IPU2_SESRA
MLSFLDAYQGYNKIPLAPEDQEKHHAVRLKNAGATYQRIVNHMFSNQIERNMEVYIDDMLVESVKEQDHVKDLEECFQVLKNIDMKLNHAKCAFGVKGEKFLGYMIYEREIEANPEKIKVIMDMPPPRSIKEVQKSAGKLVALNCFISRSAEKGLPFFKVLCGVGKFKWNKTSQDALDELKSKVLQGTEIGYFQIEKLALSLVIAKRKLRPYFQSYKVVVLTNHPLKQVLANPELSGKRVKWAVELTEFCVEFRPRPAIKAQLLADFVAKLVYDEAGISKLTWSLYVNPHWWKVEQE